MWRLREATHEMLHLFLAARMGEINSSLFMYTRNWLLFMLLFLLAGSQ
jgi:hypothetical protein